MIFKGNENYMCNGCYYDTKKPKWLGTLTTASQCRKFVKERKDNKATKPSLNADHCCCCGVSKPKVVKSKGDYFSRCPLMIHKDRPDYMCHSCYQAAKKSEDTLTTIEECLKFIEKRKDNKATKPS